MASPVTNMLDNPDLLSDPTFLLVAGVASLAVVVATTWCLQSKKPSPPSKVEETPAPVKDKGKAKAAPQKKGKQEKVKLEKKNYSVDHPLWISSTNTGNEIIGFSYDVCSSICSRSPFMYFTSFSHHTILFAK